MTWPPDDTYIPMLRPDLHSFEVGPDLVIWDPSPDRLHHLEPWTAEIVSRVTGTRSVIEITSDLQADFEADPDTLRTAVLGTLSAIRDRGLLVDGAGARAGEADGRDTEPTGRDSDRADPSDGSMATEASATTVGLAGTPGGHGTVDDPDDTDGPRPVVGPPAAPHNSASRGAGTVYAALGFVFTVASNDDEIGDEVRRACAPLALPDGATADHAVRHYRFQVDRSGARPTVAVSLDGELLFSVDATQSLAALFSAEFTARSIAVTDDDVLLLHGGAVCNDDRTVLLVGVSGAGKTTLTTACVAGGWRYVTDEIVALDPTSFGVRPFPRVLALDAPGTVLFPELADVRAPTRPGSDDREWHLDPHLLAGRAATADQLTPPVTTIVVPRFEPGAVTTLQPIDAMAGYFALAESRFASPLPTERGLDAIARLIPGVACFSLVFGDARAAADLLTTSLAPA